MWIDGHFGAIVPSHRVMSLHSEKKALSSARIKWAAWICCGIHLFRHRCSGVAKARFVALE